MTTVDRAQRLRGAVLVVSVALVLLVLVADPVDLPRGGMEGWGLILWTLAVIVVADSRPAAIADGRQATPVGLTASLALGMVTSLPDHTLEPVSGGLVLVVVAAGALGARWLRGRRGGEVGAMADVALRLGVVALATGLMRFPGRGSGNLVALEQSWRADGAGWMTALSLLLVATVCVFVQLTIRVLERSFGQHIRLRHVISEEVAISGPLALGVVCSAVMVALATSVVGAVAVPVFVVPLVLLVLAIRGQAAVRSAQRQTVHALSRLTDQGGFTSPGHAARVAVLAVQVGRDFGMSEGALRDVEYAGLLHDLGQVSLDRPIPHGATTHTSALDQRRLAATGASLLSRTAELSRLAPTVAHQATPYWRTEQLGQLPAGSRILRVVNAYDDLMLSAEHPARPQAALLRLRLGAGYEYDPEVIKALARVLLRGGLISKEGLRDLDL